MELSEMLRCWWVRGGRDGRDEPSVMNHDDQMDDGINTAKHYAF